MDKNKKRDLTIGALGVFAGYMSMTAWALANDNVKLKKQNDYLKKRVDTTVRFAKNLVESPDDALTLFDQYRIDIEFLDQVNGTKI